MTPTWRQRMVRWLDRTFPEYVKDPEPAPPAPVKSLRDRIELCERWSEEAQQHAQAAAYHIDTPAGKLPARQLAEVSQKLYAEALMVWAITKES